MKCTSVKKNNFCCVYKKKFWSSLCLDLGASGCTGVFSCDHICLPLPSNRFVCACADGYTEAGARCIQTGIMLQKLFCYTTFIKHLPVVLTGFFFSSFVDENATFIQPQAKSDFSSSKYITCEYKTLLLPK